MKVAVTVCDNKISPSFDSTYKFTIIHINNGKIKDKEEIVLFTINPIQRVNDIADMYIDTIICGEINQYTLSCLVKEGINVIPGVIGSAKEVVNLFLIGKLKPRITIFPDGKIIYRRSYYLKLNT